MLSFFRTKSDETTVDKIISGTHGLSIEHIERAANKLDTMDSAAIANNHDSLLKSLGYQNAVDLKECIYGNCF